MEVINKSLLLLIILYENNKLYCYSKNSNKYSEEGI